MRKASLAVMVVVLSLGTVTLVRADARVERKTQVHLGGVMGGLVNRLGGKAAREGLVETTVVKGNRRRSILGDRGEIVDLDEEKVYHLDFGSKTYTVETFDELRRRMRSARESAGGGPGRPSRRTEAGKPAGRTEPAEKGPEFDVDFTMKETGQKRNINGFDTHQVVATFTVREKGRKLEEGGGAVLTADTWLGPRLAEVREVEEFDRRYYQKLYGDVFTAEMAQAAMLMATTPAFGVAMKKFRENKVKLDGTAIRTALDFQVVPAPGQGAGPGAEAGSPATAIGGIFGRLKQRSQAGEAEKPPVPGESGRQSLFSSNTEIVKASASAGTEEVAIPAGFRQK